jgi:oligoendopeptidase F
MARGLRIAPTAKKVFDAFWGAWKHYERTFGVTFYEMLKTDTVYANVRRYPDSITRKLDPQKIPTPSTTR